VLFVGRDPVFRSDSNLRRDCGWGCFWKKQERRESPAPNRWRIYRGKKNRGNAQPGRI